MNSSSLEYRLAIKFTRNNWLHPVLRLLNVKEENITASHTAYMMTQSLVMPRPGFLISKNHHMVICGHETQNWMCKNSSALRGPPGFPPFSHEVLWGLRDWCPFFSEAAFHPHWLLINCRLLNKESWQWTPGGWSGTQSAPPLSHFLLLMCIGKQLNF